ncbi:MAG TPA: UPF0280 family protein [Candidatus Omnitrophota bacterium]|nr:UPF0280 family protein [Candidatus Omnitrophota bacterium]
MQEERKYRDYIRSSGLVKFTVAEQETDLLILAKEDLTLKAKPLVERYRKQLENFISQNPGFREAFHPFRVPFLSPRIVRDMAWAAKRCMVGPMAAVAGAMAEAVGRELMVYSREVIVENGGDNFISIKRPIKVGIFAGASPFSEKIALEIDPADSPCGVCTSSGTVGPSFSFGKADAVCVVARSAALADAAASAIGNVVQDVNTINDGLEVAKKIKGLTGVLIIKDDRMGAIGKIKIVSV